MNLPSRLATGGTPTFKLMRTIPGALAIGLAVAVSSFTMVRAEHARPDKSKTYACTAGVACLEGSSTGGNTFGLYGVSTGTAVVGKTTGVNGNSGVAGSSNGTSGFGLGVYGFSSNGQGVYGVSTAPGAAGVAGYQLNEFSSTGYGLYGESADTTGNFTVIYGQGDTSSTYLFDVRDSATSSSCVIDPYADLFCSGSTDVKTVRTRHLTSSGQHVLAYAAESASATLDDVGTARMVDGVANVAIDRAFASTIDRNSAYHVFVTPLGESRGWLYVTSETPTGFQVREAQSGHSTLSFDYRIIARPIDAKNDRLPLAAPPPHFATARGGLRPAH
jgi:hypothetical protein